jgi:hypothetical protein
VGRKIAAVVCGLVAWIIIATVLNWMMRAGWPGYAEAEAPMTFTLPMMLGRLAVGGLSSVGAGIALALVAKRGGSAAMVLGVLLLAAFLPVHYRLWDKFPVWYHAVFLISLLPLALLGARLAERRSAEGAVG